ncbi:hypothetical protein [Deinococcus sp. Marseille-Q6407]|uniref:hypothetical protein n=1 Tax=Deinococcus sp. Marseille-Q6407 TaxID=2969223 RepID=UPI0021C0845A|nr:hypothetical protein [Deinococcus sp. Marseille-Q6407]
MARYQKASRSTSRKSTLRRLLPLLLPVGLELLTQYRSSQRARQSRLYRPGRREQLFDTLLDTANRRFGRRSQSSRKGRGFF